MNDNGFNNYNDNNDSSDNNTNIYHGDYSENLKSSGFYSESYKKPKKKKGILFQLVIVAVISSILGGTAVAGFFQFVTPILQSSSDGYISKVLNNNQGTQNNTTQNSDALKRVEIVQTAESPVTAIAEKVSPSIVGIKTTFQVQDSFFGLAQDSGSEGSGIIIKNDGYIMTNNHVIEGALTSGTNSLSKGAKIEVILPNQMDKPYEATVIGRDSKTDLAVIKIDASELPAAELGNSDDLKVGELAVAIGNPAGLEYMGSVTTGVISGLNRTIPIADNKQLKLIQTDASINPGNSGGALVNGKGQVIGINTAKMGGSGFEGLGFAIPINKANEIISSLIEYKYVKGRPTIGISIETRYNEEIANQNNLPLGILVADVQPLSGAFNAGIKVGDILTKFDGKKVTTFEELEEVKNTHKPGDTVEIEIYREDNYQILQLTLGEDKS